VVPKSDVALKRKTVVAEVEEKEKVCGVHAEAIVKLVSNCEKLVHPLVESKTASLSEPLLLT
jgi:hypothetical protein